MIKEQILNINKSNLSPELMTVVSMLIIKFNFTDTSQYIYINTITNNEL